MLLILKFYEASDCPVALQAGRAVHDSYLMYLLFCNIYLHTHYCAILFYSALLETENSAKHRIWFRYFLIAAQVGEYYCYNLQVAGLKFLGL